MHTPYEADVDENKEKFYLTAAFPYPNSPQHIGHARTYTITDIYARFKRHQGKNVLFPMGFHVTGTPILAMAQRIKERDEGLLQIFEHIYKIPREIAEGLTDPRELVLFFSKEIEEGMKLLNLSIDWRRKFYTFDPHFQKFIEWQFKKLKEKGYLKKGSHYIPWSRKLKSAVGAHDTKGDVDPEIEEMFVLFLPIVEEEVFVAVATYRPETLYGLTNIWIAPNAKYFVYSTKDGKKVVMGREAADKLKEQWELEEEREYVLKGKYVENPLTGKKVPIVPSEIVDPSSGTGVVMSVPAHSVADYIAYKRANIGDEEDIPVIIRLPDLGKIPAKTIAKRYDVENKPERLKEATRKLYREELSKGVMIVENLKDVPVEKARELVKQELKEKGLEKTIYVIANGPIFSRAGDEVVVKKVENQWFIDYGNKEWKNMAKKAVSRMRFIPKKIKEEILTTIDWLKEKACTRSRGLGTPFPFDKSQVIESLSDSTIYMAFYPLMPDILKFSPEELTEEFFDYVFLGKGKPINELHEKLRRNFSYWYPLDSRHSGADLVRNHLTFFIMNHVAIFPEEYWPKQIVVNGFVLMEGKKMSKSLGNILPLKEAIKEYGADVVRFSVVSGAELDQDTNFSKSVAEGIKTRLKFFSTFIEQLGGDKELVDKWVESLFNERLRDLEVLFENFELREISLRFFYNFYNDLQKYEKIKNSKPYGLEEVFKKWVIVLHPFMPDFTSRMAEKLGISAIDLEPIPTPGVVDEELLELFRISFEILEDMEHVKNLSMKKGKELKKVVINIPDEKSFKIYNIIASARDPKDLMSKAKDEGVVPIASKYVKKVQKIKSKITRERYKEVLSYLRPYMEKELGISVEIREGEEGMPDKPKLELITT